MHSRNLVKVEVSNCLFAKWLGYLCKTTDNVYGIEFIAFKLRDLDNNTVLFEVSSTAIFFVILQVAKPADIPYEPPREDDDDSGRFVRYEFTPDFLKLRTVGAM